LKTKENGEPVVNNDRTDALVSILLSFLKASYSFDPQ